ncbi:Nif11-like leader peptide family RiPP precursor [Phormidium sp. LEGE 05292]|uniref:Nif11-like leader peptide family RiPP precursor n=1 Tax=[Phormidium] sp. LEGE 05292 TaxID=767427 RepID=UPI00187F9F39|nr:Nif11-like leader peptide family RiPP precursor [Phormidium sp. LEGE 05292]MBE9226582.1 Nif11-like leader peptide family RiPP precursor [Phormidium sp. LEGE 05292]
MTKESAHKFLEDATRDFALRDKMKEASNPDDFIKIAEKLNYSFTTQELKDVISEYSENVTMRRHTGVWPWLRDVHWI